MRKRNMYRKIGAPVEKVLDFFEDLRSRMPEKKDQEYISWMMEVIASDDLYRVRNFDAETMRKLGGEGDDQINGVAGEDLIVGGAGNDTLDGDEGLDRIFGGEGNDIIRGGVGNDHIEGGGGDDSIDAGLSNDTV